MGKVLRAGTFHGNYKDIVVANIATITHYGGGRSSGGGGPGWRREFCISPPLRHLWKAGKMSRFRFNFDRAFFQDQYVRTYPITNFVRAIFGAPRLKPKRTGYWHRPWLCLDFAGGSGCNIFFKTDRELHAAHEELIAMIEGETVETARLREK